MIMIIADSCMIWFHFDCTMQLKKNRIILLLMFVAEKVLLLLVISLTDIYRDLLQFDGLKCSSYSAGNTYKRRIFTNAIFLLNTTEQ